MAYGDPGPWQSLTRDATPVLPTAPPVQVKHPLVKVRSLVDNRFGPDGNVVQAGQVFELPSPEAAGWIALRWAEAA